MAGNSERVLIRDLDTEAEKARDAAEKAKTEYLAALTNTESSAELKELMKSDYTICAQLANTAAEAALLAKRQRTETITTPTVAIASGSPDLGSEPDDLNPNLTTVNKRPHKDLKEIVRSVGSPVGG